MRKAALLTGALILIVIGMQRNQSAEAEYEKAAKALYDVGKPDIQNSAGFTGSDWQKLHEANPEFIAYLSFESGLISLPAVQTVDNRYYLDHLFDGSPGVCGTPFFDLQSRPEDSFRLIYGHTVFGYEELMFGPLHRLTDISSLEENSRFTLYYEDHSESFEICLVMINDPSDPYGCDTRIRCLSDEEFAEWIDVAKQHAVCQRQIPYGCNDRYVILQTCMEENSSERLCILAVKVKTEYYD